MGGCCSKSEKEEYQTPAIGSNTMSPTRINMNIQGSGVLQDGTKYTRELNITETMEREGISKEVSAEKIEIGGDVLSEGHQGQWGDEDENVSDGGEFETKWEEVNRRWSRMQMFLEG